MRPHEGLKSGTGATFFHCETSEAIDRRQIDLRTFPLEYSIQKTLVSHIKNTIGAT